MKTVGSKLNFLFCGACNESLDSCAASTDFFLVSKTAIFLNYPQTKGYTKKEKCIPSGCFKHQRIRDPPLVIGCEAAKWKEKGEDNICLISNRSPPDRLARQGQNEGVNIVEKEKLSH